MAQLQNIMLHGTGPAHTHSIDSAEGSTLGFATGSTTGLETFTLEYKVRMELCQMLCPCPCL